jgi:hypothetical protein
MAITSLFSYSPGGDEKKEERKKEKKASRAHTYRTRVGTDNDNENHLFAFCSFLYESAEFLHQASLCEGSCTSEAFQGLVLPCLV